MERRLRGELLEEILAGSNDEHILNRAGQVGYDSTCLITQAPMSPLTAMQKMGYDYACTFYGGAKVVACSDIPELSFPVAGQ